MTDILPVVTLSRDDERRAYRRGWQPRDRQAFADRDLLRASTVPSRRPMPPAVAEWLDEQEALDGPPSYVDVDIILAAEDLAHVDRLHRDSDLATAIAAVLDVDVSRLTLNISTS